MENASIKHEAQIGVFEIPGEPAIIINGVPDEPETDGAIVTADAQSHGTVGCCEWLEGREVRKLFLGRYYSGKVLKFDKRSGWYRVEYEDGDSEDLDWHELEEVLLPLDVTTPLKSVALPIVRSRQPLGRKYGRTRTRNTKTRISGAKGMMIEAGEESVIAQTQSDRVESGNKGIHQNHLSSP